MNIYRFFLVLVIAYSFYYMFIPKKLYFIVQNELDENVNIKVQTDDYIFMDTIEPSYIAPEFMFYIKTKRRAEFFVSAYSDSTNSLKFGKYDCVNMLWNRYIRISIWDEVDSKNKEVEIDKLYSYPIAN